MFHENSITLEYFTTEQGGPKLGIYLRYVCSRSYNLPQKSIQKKIYIKLKVRRNSVLGRGASSVICLVTPANEVTVLKEGIVVAREGVEGCCSCVKSHPRVAFIDRQTSHGYHTLTSTVSPPLNNYTFQ